MYITSFEAEARSAARPLGVSIVMPCLNEAVSLPHCIRNARTALDMIEATCGLAGEIVIADNGSTDGSQHLATSLDARVVAVARRGYGAAIIGGAESALGEYLLIGDADGSYDFTDGVAMIARLVEGADVCMGSRFAGSIAAGAMPWKNRHIGNPLLTGLLNRLFGTHVDDAHCGLRAITRESFLALRLTGAGMEFASEMVVKAGLKRLRIAQVPVTLSRDLRDRPPHLRPWRDGWRHLRYLMMLSPTWLFGAPGLAAMLGAGAVLAIATAHHLGLLAGAGSFGPSWMVVAGFLLCVGHLSCVMAATGYLHSVDQGYRAMRPALRRYGNVLTLETMLMIGTGLIALALLGLTGVGLAWSNGGYVALSTTLPVVLAGATGTLGLQTIIGGFVLSIVGGHEARFLAARSAANAVAAVDLPDRRAA